MTAIAPESIQAFVQEHPGWEHKHDSLICSFPMMDFLSGLDFTNDVASLAEEKKHHPMVLLQYPSVTITLNTHDAGNKVTEKDIEMAQLITELYNGGEDIDDNLDIEDGDEDINPAALS